MAGVTTNLTIDLMRDLGEFAQTVRAHDLTILPYWRTAMYVLNTVVILAYLWPIVAFFRHGTDTRAPLVVQRRVTSAPLLIAGMGFGSWALGILVFPAITLYRFGRWSPVLLSQHIFSPIVNGFLASTTSYLLIDLVFRRMVVPRVFPTGRLAEVPGSLTPAVSARLFLFLVAVAFIPLFTMLGLVRAARVRVGEGFAADAVLESLTHASTVTFLLYVVLGIGLTLVLAWSLTRPLREMASALRRVQAGDLEVRVPVDSSDEVGVLEDGVNALVATLRERERILQTFGRVVEPSVRDRLLAGAVGTAGELRTATVLFCDLHGFTAMAERARPAEVVATLNAFFTALTAWVRECGGFVDKFIGDAMLVVFGLFDVDASRGVMDAPDASREPVAYAPVVAGSAGAAAALRCALGMRACLDGLNATRAAQGLAPLAVSVGVHTGEVLAGTIGAADRHEYTVIGDTVNVASRLQQLCKEQGRTLLVSETTYEAARGAGFEGELTVRDSVQLRGRSGPVGVFAVA